MGNVQSITQTLTHAYAGFADAVVRRGTEVTVNQYSSQTFNLLHIKLIIDRLYHKHSKPVIHACTGESYVCIKTYQIKKIKKTFDQIFSPSHSSSHKRNLTPEHSSTRMSCYVYDSHKVHSSTSFALFF